jgi:hypothetical protein
MRLSTHTLTCGTPLLPDKYKLPNCMAAAASPAKAAASKNCTTFFFAEDRRRGQRVREE